MSRASAVMASMAGAALAPAASRLPRAAGAKPKVTKDGVTHRRPSESCAASAAHAPRGHEAALIDQGLDHNLSQHGAQAKRRVSSPSR